MTFDVTLMKGKKEFPTPLTIHGMSYGAKVLDLAKPFVFSDKNLTPDEAKVLGVEFHKLMVEYCQKITGGNYFGSDGTGYYFYKAGKLSHDAEAYNTAIRWLQVYITAVAFGVGIEFH